MSVAEGPATSSGRGRWRAGLLFGGVGVVCFSGTAPATRVAVPVFGSATLTCARIVIAAVLGAVTLAVTGRLRWPGHREVGGLLVMGIGLAVGYPLFLALAVERVPAYHGAVVIGLTPAATAAIAAVRTAERPGSRFWLASVVGLGAVVFFALGQSGGGLQLADAWLAAAVLSCAIGYVEGARTARRIGAVSALCWAMILLMPAAVPALVWLATRDYPPVSASAWAGLGYAGVASMFAGSLAWYHGLSTGGTARIGQLNLAQPFLAIVWSAVLVGEHITWAVPATAAVIVACMAVCITSPPPAPHSTPALPGKVPIMGDEPHVITVTRVIDAPTARVFAYLANPANHRTLDTSGMIRGSVDGEPVTEVGAVFVMKMHNEMKGDHQIQNHVVVYEPDRAIGWAPAEPGHEPAEHTFLWHLATEDGDRTVVTQTYNRSAFTHTDMLSQLPVVNRDQLQASLDLLAENLTQQAEERGNLP